jgi:two-component system invasion response regulator UvrY
MGVQGMGSVKLFLVEDQLLMRQAIARALSVTDKYEVVGHAPNAQDLISNPQNCHADVIILDTVLERASWLESLHQLRAKGVKAPVLILAADENQNSLNAALQAGANGYLPKRSDFKEMESAIDAVANGGRYISPKFNEHNQHNGRDGGGCTSEVLSAREYEIFVLLAQGKKNREIGKQLSISTRTVDTHRSNILKKLQMRSNAELVKMAISEGLVGLS